MNFIIGTAGHIDHGKTSLIGALTGRQTDRLEEEQKRGISIDLGFTYFDLPSGIRAGIVDVPGHERFIRNMIAGATGIDLVLFVIAADEGPMPQTIEHLNILRFLEVKDAIIVVTKWDKADEVMRELVVEEIQEMQKEEHIAPFFKDAPIICVDSLSGYGIEKLVTIINEKAENLSESSITKQARLPIDRAFSLKGIGTIITGTLIEGEIKIGDELIIYPSMIETKVRSVQVHDEDKEIAYKGQRTALHIANVKKEEINRGDVIATPHSLEVTDLLDVKLTLLHDSPIEIKHFTRGRFYLGAKEVMGRIIPLGQKSIKRGETAFCQIRLEETIVAKKEDVFVLRQFSPLVTIGGGVVLDANPPFHKASDALVVESLEVKDMGSPKELVSLLVKENAEKGISMEALEEKLKLSPSDGKLLLDELAEEKEVFLLENKYYHKELLNFLLDGMVEMLKEYHNQYPFRQGMLKETMRKQLTIEVSQPLLDMLVSTWGDSLVEIKNQNYVALKDFSIHYTKEQEKKKDELLATILEGKFKPPQVSEFISNDTEAEEMLMAEVGHSLVRLDQDTYMHKNNIDRAVSLLTKHLETHETITLADFRDMLETTRKYAMLLLEYFDRQRITLRVGDERKLYRKS